MNKLFIITLILVLPVVALAQNYVPLVGIPGVDDSDGFGTYINSLYGLSISIAALLAVIKIIIAGVKWMMTDIAPNKSDAKKDIQGALLGLLVILAAVLILTVINPDLGGANIGFEDVDGVTATTVGDGGSGLTLGVGNPPPGTIYVPCADEGTGGCSTNSECCGLSCSNGTRLAGLGYGSADGTQLIAQCVPGEPPPTEAEPIEPETSSYNPDNTYTPGDSYSIACYDNTAGGCNEVDCADTSHTRSIFSQTELDSNGVPTGNTIQILTCTIP